MNRRNFLQMTATSAVASTWLLGGCWNPVARFMEPEEEVPVYQENGLLRFAFSEAPETFDPALASNLTEYNISILTHDALVWVNRFLEPRPYLAESWEHSDDLLTWTFILNQNAIFHHDDLPLIADDVVYSIERILDADTGSPLRSALSFIRQIKAIDDYTVQFVLREPKLDLPILLGAPQARIVSRKYEPRFLPQKPSGSGYFRFDEYIQGESLLLSYNPDFWLEFENARIETIEHRYIPSLTEQVEALKNDEVDVITSVSFSQADALREEPDIVIKETASGAHLAIVMRPGEPPFDNVLVRQAMKQCLDREVILQEILSGHGEIANDHPVPSSSPYWSDLPLWNYDPDQARLLLEEAGYPDGIQLDLITSNVGPGMVELAEMYKEMAQPAGIEITVTEVSPDIYWSDYWNQHAPFFISSWNFRPSIDETFMISYHSKSEWNETQWHTPELDELLTTARYEIDHERQVELYHQAQEVIRNDGAVIIPYFRPVLMAMHKRVHGLNPHPANWIVLINTSLLVDEGS